MSILKDVKLSALAIVPLGIVAAAVLSPAAQADNTEFCDAWARKTSKQYDENYVLRCLPLTDINPSLSANFHSCMAIGQELADRFTKLVEDRLAECRARAIKERGALTPGPKIGDILKETKPPATPPAPAGGNTATVIADVDVYKAAGGVGAPVGVLLSNNKTTKVSLVEPCQDNWCHVKGNPVPTGEGWVYSGTPPDFQSLSF